MLVYEKIKITHCKLKKFIQKRLLEFFYVRSNGSFSHRFTRYPSQFSDTVLLQDPWSHLYHLALEADRVMESLMGKLSLMRAILVDIVKENKVMVRQGKWLFWGILKRQGKVFAVIVNDTKTTTRMPVITRKIKPDSSFIQILICSMSFMWASFTTNASIIRSYLRWNKITSIVLKFL